MVFMPEPDELELVRDGDGDGGGWFASSVGVVPGSVFGAESGSDPEPGCAWQQTRPAARRRIRRAPQLQDLGPHRTSPQKNFLLHSLHSLRPSLRPPPPMRLVDVESARWAGRMASEPRRETARMDDATGGQSEHVRVCVCSEGRLHYV